MQKNADWVIRETFESALLMSREAIIALGADESQADEAMEELRRRDAERFVLEANGGAFAGLKRQSLGVWVLLFLAFFTFMAWLLKKEYWKDVH